MDNNTNENERLESPLVVHKESDASYKETANEVQVDVTHIEAETATLERHRFKKEPKKSKAPVVISLILIIALAVGAYLYFGKGFSFKKTVDETSTEPQASAYYVPDENPFEGIITVKGTYIFFEGTEINGVEELISEIKYLDEGTNFIVQDESADPTLLNEEVLTTLTNYGMTYEVKYIISSGLISQYETTAPPVTEAQTETPADDSAEAENTDVQE